MRTLGAICFLLGATFSSMAQGDPGLKLVDREEAANEEPAWAAKVASALNNTTSPIPVVIQYARQSSVLPGGVGTPPREKQQTDGEPDKSIAVRERLQSSGVTITREYTYLPMIRARITAAHLDQLRNDPDIINVFIEEHSKPRDDVPPLSADLEAPQLWISAPSISADTVWNMGYRGQGQTVAVLDDGMYTTHSWFAGRIPTEACFSSTGSNVESLCPNGTSSQIGFGAASNCQIENDVCGHGTHVAGIVAGDDGQVTFPSHLRVRGIAHQANVIPIQVFRRHRSTTTCDGESSCLLSSSFDQLDALNWVIENAATYNIVAVNLSLSSGEYSSACDDTAVITSAVNALKTLGVATVAAAGNEGLVGSIGLPACIDNVIAVSGTISADADLVIPDPDYNHAPIVDLLAPGTLIRSAGTPPDNASVKSGTSMAAPHVAGAFALLKSADPSVTVEQLEFALESTGQTESSIASWTTPLIDLDDALAVLGTNPPFEGVGIAGFFHSNEPGALSFLRIYNPSNSSGSAEINVINDFDGQELGRFSRVIPANSSLQFSMAEIESDIGVNPATLSGPFYSLQVDSTFNGFATHVLWNPVGGALTNVSACSNGLSSSVRYAGNVHTSLIQNFPSSIYVYNAGTSGATPIISVHSSTTGALIGSVSSSSDIIPNTMWITPAQSILDFLNFQPAAGEGHVNFQLNSGFNGFIAHIVDNETAGVITDMTAKCDIN